MKNIIHYGVIWVLHWVNRIADRVDALAKGDPDFRALDRQRKALEPGYEMLLSRLSPEDRELLLEYMDVTGNMQYRKTQLAWLYGKLHPHE